MLFRNGRSAQVGYGGPSRNRTGVYGFAVRCVTTPPSGLARHIAGVGLLPQKPTQCNPESSQAQFIRHKQCSFLSYVITGRKALGRSEEHTSEIQSLMRSSYTVFCLEKKTKQNKPQ